MGSKLSCLRSNHGSIKGSRNNNIISLGKGRKSSMITEQNIQAKNYHSKGCNKLGSRYAKKALFCLKKLIEKCDCKLKKLKISLAKSAGQSSNGKKSHHVKKACCACISSEKRIPFANGLFKMKTFLLKGGGGGGDINHGGSKGNSNINGGKNCGGVDGKGTHDQKKQK